MNKSHVLASAFLAVFGAAASSAWAAPVAPDATGAGDTPTGGATFSLVPNLLSQGSSTFSSSSYVGGDPYGNGVGSLNDGVFYAINDGDTTGSVTPYPYPPAAGAVTNIATFNLDTSVNTQGYTITSIDSYTGYSGGLTSQSYTVAFSTVSAPGVFTPYETVSVGDLGEEVQVVLTDDSGTLATNVADLQFTFNTPTSDFTEVFREFEAFGSPTLSAVPEPASLGLLSIGGLAMLRRRRRLA